tara:strand:- start:27 stop:635 length:609 start_codon:yes stop_codon:yes gene_type:complete
MIHIDAIQIFGFKGSNRVARAKFSNSSVSVIYGPNGCGKTSFLKVLYGILAQKESFLSENSVKKIILDITFEEKSRSISVFREDEGIYNWEQVINSPLDLASSLSLGVDRGTTSQSIKAEPRIISMFFSHPFRRGYLSKSAPLQEVSEELSKFLRQYYARNRHRNRSTEFTGRNLYLQDIKIENIEELLINRYQVARYTELC